MNLQYNDQPIGVFDSGVGGLTVLKALQQQLPQESFIYLGDTARLPYGTKSPETVVRYARQAAKILFERGIKMLVVACNTASAFAITALQDDFVEIPVIDVIKPGATAACAATDSGEIAVIATEATVQHGAYEAAIKLIRSDAKVVSQSCSVLVALAEEGWSEGEIAEAVVQRYLDPLFANSAATVDTLVLGCTHFPKLYKTIKKVTHEKITIVDSAHTTAEVVASELAKRELQSQRNVNESYTKFLATDAPDRFIQVAQRFLNNGLDIGGVELVDL